MNYELSKGSHSYPGEGRCAMEWVAFLAGEPHSDAPRCVSVLLRTFCISLNDALSYDQRQRLRPYLARTIGTRDDGFNTARAWMCLDWMVRDYLPAWLDKVSVLKADARALRSLSPIVSLVKLTNATNDIVRARQNAEAVWEGRGRPNRVVDDRLGSIARRVAQFAARGTVGVNMLNEVWKMARYGTWAAGASVAQEEISSTVKQLQDSILIPGGLLDRMLPLEPIVIPAYSEWREVCFAQG